MAPATASTTPRSSAPHKSFGEVRKALRQMAGAQQFEEGPRCGTACRDLYYDVALALRKGLNKQEQSELRQRASKYSSFFLASSSEDPLARVLVRFEKASKATVPPSLLWEAICTNNKHLTETEVAIIHCYSLNLPPLSMVINALDNVQLRTSTSSTMQQFSERLDRALLKCPRFDGQSWLWRGMGLREAASYSAVEDFELLASRLSTSSNWDIAFEFQSRQEDGSDQNQPTPIIVGAGVIVANIQSISARPEEMEQIILPFCAWVFARRDKEGNLVRLVIVSQPSLACVIEAEQKAGIINSAYRPRASRTPADPAPALAEPRAAHPGKSEWRVRFTNDQSVAAAVSGCCFSSTLGFTHKPHDCCNIQKDGPLAGQGCHVGLYHMDDEKARTILKSKREAFLLKSAKARAEQVFAELTIRADGVGETLRESQCFEVRFCHEPPADSPSIGLKVLSYEDEGEFIWIVTEVYGKAKMHTNIQKADEIVQALGVHQLERDGSFDVLALDEADEISMTVRRWSAGADVEFKIGRRQVCKDVFQARYPISDSTMLRLCNAKREEWDTCYSLRPKTSSVSDDSRAIRGDIAVAWLLKYVEENSERIPDVSIRLLPCKKLAAVWLEYTVDQKAIEFQPKPLECGQFRHVFNTDHRLCNVKISNMKRNFSKCSICVKGEAAILRSLRNKDPVKYHEVCGFEPLLSNACPFRKN